MLTDRTCKLSVIPVAVRNQPRPPLEVRLIVRPDAQHHVRSERTQVLTIRLPVIGPECPFDSLLYPNFIQAQL